MERKDVEKKLAGASVGAFYDITYHKNCNVSAANKKQGIAVIKQTSTTMRVGCKYENMSDTEQYKKEHPGEQPKQLAEKEWHIPNMLFTNKSSGKVSLRVGRVKKAVPHSKFYKEQNGVRTEITKDEAVALCIASEFAPKQGTPNPVWDIRIENIESMMRSVDITEDTEETA